METDVIHIPDIASRDFIVSMDITEDKGRIGLRDVGPARILTVVAEQTPSATEVVGARIRTFRQRTGLTQAEFGTQIGASQGRISDWERGRYKSMDLFSLLRLAKHMKTPLWQLIEGLDPEYDSLDRGLPRHTLSDKTPANMKAGGHGAPQVDARVLQEQERTFEQFRRKVSDLAVELANLSGNARHTGGKNSTSEDRQSKGSGRPRRAR